LDTIQKAGWQTISCRDLLAVTRGEMAAPRKAMVLTFDDGHLSNWLTVVPELEKRGMTGTFFVLTDFTVPGDIRTPESAPAMLPMREVFIRAHLDGDFSQFINESEIKAMLGKGMEIFSHGCRHQAAFKDLRPLPAMGKPGAHWGAWSIYPGQKASWPTFKAVSGYVYDGFWPKVEGLGEPKMVKRTVEERAAFCRKDFQKSFKRIQALNGYDEQLFCWPWGHFDDVAEAELKAAGYVGAFSLERWSNRTGTNPFRLHRIGVGRNKSSKWLLKRLGMYGNVFTADLCFKLFRKPSAVNAVLYTTDSDKLSGGSRQMINNIKAMSEMGLRTYALIKPGSALNGALEGLNVEIIHFDGFTEYFKAGKFLKRFIQKHGIDVVHTFHNRAYKMGVLARLMGARFKLFINRGVISRPNTIFFLWTALADGVIANSIQCAEIMRRHGVWKKRLNVIYNAYAGPYHGEPKQRKKRGTRFIYVGNGAHIKGFDVFLGAADKVCATGARDIEFVGVGVSDTDLQHKTIVQAMTPAVRERYRNEGPLSHTDVLEALRFSDVQVVSSRMESLPNTLLEGFELGVPAVCTRVGGIPELVRDGVNGYLCDSEDVDCLAQKMLLLAEDPVRRFDMGRAGWAVISKLLTVEAKARNLMRVYMGETLFEPLPVESVALTKEQSDEGQED